MQPEIAVLLDAIVERVGFPGVGEEDEGDGLAKGVELEAAGADGVHDGCVVDDTHRDAFSAGAEDDVDVGCRAVSACSAG